MGCDVKWTGIKRVREGSVGVDWMRGQEKKKGVRKERTCGNYIGC